MPIKVTCSNCGGVLHAPDDSAGKRGRCPTCGTVLTITPDPVGAGSGALPFGAPVPARPETAAPINNPWGSLPGGPEESNPGVQVSNKAGAPPTALPSRSITPSPQPEPVPPTLGSRVPPDPRKNTNYAANDPFAKPSKPKSDDTETNAKWLKVRRGLGWVRTGVFLGLLGTLAYCIIPILSVFGISLPNQSPGFLKIEAYSQLQEIRLFATLGPILLGLLCVWIGCCFLPRDFLRSKPLGLVLDRNDARDWGIGSVLNH
jgi:hypothetical protein